MDYEKELLALLKNNDWITSHDLSTLLNCSTRTIKKYISRLKETYPIISSNKGYKLCYPSSKLINNSKNKDIPQNQRERVKFIIKELTINSSKEITLDDLIDLLFISESSLRKDILATEKFLNKYNCKILIKKRNLHLLGKESDIRKLISDIIRQESNSSFFDLKNLSTFFPEYDINKLRNKIHEIMSSYKLKITDIALASLTRHLVITMYRLKTKNIHMTTKIMNNFVNNNQEIIHSIVGDISGFIKDYYDVQLYDDEKQELGLLIYSKIFQSENMNHFSISSSKSNGINFSTNKIKKFINEMVKQVYSTFYIQLNYVDFKKRFNVHLQGLIFRSENNLMADNPLTKSTKLEVPFLYEIAVFISNLISKQFNININDDEITYIVFHIGSYLEEKSLKNKDTTKYNCTLLFPNIGHSYSSYQKTIEDNFSKVLVVNKVITEFSEFNNKEKGTLLITSVSDIKSNYKYVVTVSPLLTNRDFMKIKNIIKQIKNEEIYYTTRSNLMDIFSENIFSIETNFKSKWEVIYFMCNELLKQKYITEKYISEVTYREKLSSTAFGKFAIPHSLNMDAIKTGIYVVIQKNPIKWDDNEVNIVFLLAFSHKNRYVFRKTFEQITDKLLQPKTLTKVISSTNFDEFMDNILK